MEADFLGALVMPLKCVRSRERESETFDCARDASLEETRSRSRTMYPPVKRTLQISRATASDGERRPDRKPAPENKKARFWRASLLQYRGTANWLGD